MSYTKPNIYNLALSALLLSREVTDTTTDQSNEVRVLNTNWNVAFESTLEDLDLDSHSSIVTLELTEDIRSNTDYPWYYVYKYPSSCIKFRRIVSGNLKDDRDTLIDKATMMYGDQKSIFTDEVSAKAEIISKNISLTTLTGMQALAIAYKLAYLSAPLITGKGAKSLMERIEAAYTVYKTEAQSQDVEENFRYKADYEDSEWVKERLS